MVQRRHWSSLAEHAGFVRALAAALIRDPAGADDLVQETWLAALRDRPRDATRTRGWLAGIMRNLARRFLRDDRRRRRRHQRGYHQTVAVRTKTAPSSYDRAAQAETLQAVLRELAELEPDLRDLVLERYYDGRSAREIAARLGLPVETVRTRLKRALARLRGAMERRHGGMACLVALVRSPKPGTVAGAVAASKGVLAMASKLGFTALGAVLGIGATLAVQGMPADATTRTRPRSADSRSETSPSPARPKAPAAATPAAAPDTPAAPEAHTGTERLGKSADAFLRRINDAPLWQGAQAAGREIAQLPPDEGLAILRAIYGRIVGVEKQRQILKPFVFAPHPHVLPILDLAMQAEAPGVREWALEYAGWFGFRGFESADAYESWRRTNRESALPQTVERGVRAHLRKLHGLPPRDALAALRWSPPWPREGLEPLATAPILRQEGFVRLAEGLLALPLPNAAAERAEALDRTEELWQWITASKPDEAIARRLVLPVLRRAITHEPDQHTAPAIRALARTGDEWAFQALARTLRTPLVRTHAKPLGVAFGNRGDARAIPLLIRAIATYDEPAVRDGLGWFGLNMLTGRSGTKARWNTSPDAAWWLTWWDEHEQRYPESVRSIDPRR